MPVEAADNMQTAMDRSVRASTWCEQTVPRSDSRVRKTPACSGMYSLSNQIHKVKRACRSKSWKTRRKAIGEHYKHRLTTAICFPQSVEARSGKPGTTRCLRFIFLMRTNAGLCQTGQSRCSLWRALKIADTLHPVFCRSSAGFLCAIRRGAGRVCAARRR